MSAQTVATPKQAGVRAARLGDLDALLALETTAFSQDRLNRRQLRHLLRYANAKTFVAEADEQVVGYICVLFSRAHAHARIYSIAVAAHARGRGLGGALLAAAEAAATKRRREDVRLEVHCRNKNAIALYHRCGYRQFAVVNDYYADHGQALRFEKPLPRPPLNKK